MRLGAIALAVIAGCATLGCQSTVNAPAVTTAARVSPPLVPPVKSEVSQELEAYYSRVQSNLLSQGLLRVDGGGPDTPFTADMLANNFMRIALFEEYAKIGGQMVAKQTPSYLHRWEQPVRLKIEFGPSVPQQIRTTDHTRVKRLVSRLGRATGHPVSEVAEDANFHVFVVNENERHGLKSRIRQIVPGISDAAVMKVTRMPRSHYCIAFAWDPDDSGTYREAVAIIRAEHPDLMRLSCLHEEIAQGFGLSNDSPKARPSVFNDDEEFGLLTHHDELLLKMLYDDRLKPGMTPDEAAPIVQTLARELVGGAG
ncbi:MAG: DUF2927 domain-containing protein [Pseudomonadota bacterium]